MARMLGIRSTDWIGLVLTLAVAGSLGYLLLAKDLAAMAALTEEQKALSVTLDESTEVVSTVTEGKELLDQLDERIAALSLQIPDALDFEAFFRSLTALSEEHNVALSTIELGENMRGEGYVALPVSFSAEATLENFHGFLFAMKRLPRLNKVERLTFLATAEPGQCAVDATLMIYAAD